MNIELKWIARPNQYRTEHLSNKAIQRPSTSSKGATGKSPCTAAALERCSRPCIHQMEPEGDYLNLTQVFIKLPLWPPLHDER